MISKLTESNDSIPFTVITITYKIPVNTYFNVIKKKAVTMIHWLVITFKCALMVTVS